MNRFLGVILTGLVFGILMPSSSGCSNQTNSETMPEDSTKNANALINESSPYLLQHAYNPVDWMPWSDKAFEKATAEDKLVLVSIGYSSCHWCHVMEHESFENEEVATLMNERFICIKVDREERPDVDNIYMTAVQLMTGSGGWPLNCFTLPDGRPIFGGTYFPKNKWMEVLENLAEGYARDKETYIDYAEKLTEGVAQTEIISVAKEEIPFRRIMLDSMIMNWKPMFDKSKGGNRRAPKFPIPNNYEFMTDYGIHYGDDEVLAHVDLTLTKMARGGIYDQVGGGFARYSTDMDWKVPHFEKMLYDNGQLVSLYSKGYQRTKNLLYKEVVYQTIDWIKREMMTKESSFYSALDADSEGEEGKFYVWEKEELKNVLADDYDWVKDYYNVGPRGMWEGNFILLREVSDEDFATEMQWSREDLRKKVDKVNSKLLKAREKRIRPGLDDKSLTSWNAIMMIGLLDAYAAFGEKEFLDLAKGNAEWIEKYQLKDDGGLYHSYKEGVSKIDGFLEDYAFVISASLKLYEATFDESYLTKADKLARYAIDHFFDDKSGMFFFTSASGDQLITRKMEINDNVIPASNSELARALFKLGSFYDNQDYKDKASQMLTNVYSDMAGYYSGYTNWGILAMNMTEPYFEVAVTGAGWEKKLAEMNKRYLPNMILMGGQEGELPLLEGKFGNDPKIFVCVNKACMRPVEAVSDAISQMEEWKKMDE
jgi:uncharacterized protein